MTTNVLPSRPARTRFVSPGAALRLLWIEIKRNAWPWTLPLLTVLFFYDTYRTASGYPPIWTVRALVIPNRLLFDFAALAAGLSAWAGSREGRRKTGDLLTTTVRSAWARQLGALAATLLWVLLAFLAAVGMLYVQTARVATWGGPPLWPVAAGVVEMTMICAIGFTAGVLFPGRFTAPLLAIVGGVLPLVGTHQVNDPNMSSLYDLLSPSTDIPQNDIGVFYHVPLDVSIVQVMFMGGIVVAALGALALSTALRPPAGGLWAVGGTGRWLHAVPVALVAAGVAASGTAWGLTGTAKLDVAGWEIPALHDAASDRPVPYTPDCASGTGPRVCVHPAFSGYLDGLAAALDPVTAEIAGLPGAPVRAEQVANPAIGPFFGNSIVGTPPVYEFVADIWWGSPAGTSSAISRANLQEEFLTAFVAGPQENAGGTVTPAQQAVITALITAAGSSSQAADFVGPPVAPQVNAAAAQLAALPASTRHAWLATHLAALRVGKITLEQMP